MDNSMVGRIVSSGTIEGIVVACAIAIRDSWPEFLFLLEVSKEGGTHFIHEWASECEQRSKPQ